MVFLNIVFHCKRTTLGKYFQKLELLPVNVQCSLEKDKLKIKNSCLYCNS